MMRSSPGVGLPAMLSSAARALCWSSMVVGDRGGERGRPRRGGSLYRGSGGRYTKKMSRQAVLAARTAAATPLFALPLLLQLAGCAHTVRPAEHPTGGSRAAPKVATEEEYT